MFNWIRSTRGDHEGMKLDCEDGTEAKYWLLTDSRLRYKIVLMINDHLPTVTMIEQKPWWIIAIELKSANYVRINCNGLTAWAFVQICRFTHASKINTRMQELKERYICLQLNIQDKKYPIDLHKTPNLWNYWLDARSKIKTEVQSPSIMQAVALRRRSRMRMRSLDCLSPLGQGMSVMNFGYCHKTVYRFKIFLD